MAEFTTDTLMCKCIRTTRLYDTPYSTNASSMILMENLTFYSKKQYIADTKSMFYISAPADGNEVPTGYWCPATMVTFFPVIGEEEEAIQEIPPDTVPIEEVLRVDVVGAKTYDNYNSTETIPNGLQVGDYLVCDFMAEVGVNGYIETRNHIKGTSGIDQTIVNKWIAVDKAVSVPKGSTVTLRSTYVSRVSASSIQYSVSDSDVGSAGTRATYDADEGSTGGGGGDTTDTTTDDTASDDSATGSTIQVISADGTVTTVNTPDFTEEDTSSTDIVVTNADLTTEEGVRTLYESYGYDYDSLTEATVMGIPVGRMLFVHGMPFQYTYVTDRRTAGGSEDSDYTGKSLADESGGGDATIKSGNVDTYGRSFAKEVAAQMPIVVLVPGKAKFISNVGDALTSSSTTDVQNAVAVMFSAGSSTELGSALENFDSLSGDYQYYSMEVDTESYFKYVNAMCMSAARLMGIGDVQYHGDACESIKWQDYNTAAEQDFSIFEEVIGMDKGVSFAYDAQSSVSDTISNSTTESQFASFFNDLNSKSREIEFITGYTGSGLDELFSSTDYEQAVSSLGTGAFSGLENVVSRVKTWGENAIHGMNMRFPEIWSDSNHSRSYDLDMHFIAPYGTAFCKWRYVLVPFFHIFALAAPRSDKNVSQYASPFLIRAYSKGYFNVEMGIIESITWKRFGDGAMISDDGVPTQIDVSISFKDLYHALAMTHFYGEDGKLSNTTAFMNNTGLMDLIGTLSGVNMNRISITERASMFMSSTFSAFTSLGSNFMLGISDRVRNIAGSLHLFGT